MTVSPEVRKALFLTTGGEGGGVGMLSQRSRANGNAQTQQATEMQDNRLTNRQADSANFFALQLFCNCRLFCRQRGKILVEDFLEVPVEKLLRPAFVQDDREEEVPRARAQRTPDKTA